MNKLRKLIKKENGQSLVEFALIAPLLIMLLLGLVEFGFLFNARIQLTSAAREGARVAAVSNVNHLHYAKIAIDDSLALKSNISNIEVTYELDASNETNNIRNVVIVLKADANSVIKLFMKDPIKMEAKATMRYE